MKKILEKIYIIFVAGAIIGFLYFMGCFNSLDNVVNVIGAFFRETLKVFLGLLFLVVLALFFKPVRKFVFKIKDEDVQE